MSSDRGGVSARSWDDEQPSTSGAAPTSTSVPAANGAAAQHSTSCSPDSLTYDDHRRSRRRTNEEASNDQSSRPSLLVPRLLFPADQSSTPARSSVVDIRIERSQEIIFQSEVIQSDAPSNRDDSAKWRHRKCRSDGSLQDAVSGLTQRTTEQSDSALETDRRMANVDDELYLLGENNRLLRKNRQIEHESESKVATFTQQISDLEERLFGTEKQLNELQEQREVEKSDWEERVKFYETQIAEGKRFIDEQMQEYDQQRAHWLEENKGLQKAIETHLNVDASEMIRSASNSRGGSPMKERRTESVQTEIDISLQVTIEELTECESSKQQLQQRVQQLENDSLKVQEDLAGEISYLKNELEVNREEGDEQMRLQIVQLEGRTEELQLQLEALQSDKAMLNDQLQDSQYQVSVLQNQLQEFRCQKSVTKENDQKCHKLATEIGEIRNLIKEKDTELGSLKTDLRRTKDECEKRKAEVDHLRSCLNVSSQNNGAQNVSLEEQLVEKRKECDKMTEEMERMQTRMLAVRDVQTAFEAQKSAMDQSTAKVKEKDQRIATLVKEHKDLEHVFNETLQEKKSLDTLVLQLKEALHQSNVDYECLVREFECFKENAEAQYTTEKQCYEEQIATLNEQMENSARDHISANLPSKAASTSAVEQHVPPKLLHELLAKLTEEHSLVKQRLTDLQQAPQQRQTTVVTADAASNTDTKCVLDGTSKLALAESNQTPTSSNSSKRSSKSDKLKRVLAAVRVLFERVKFVPLADDEAVDEQINILIDELTLILSASSSDSLPPSPPQISIMKNEVKRVTAVNVQLQGQVQDYKERLDKHKELLTQTVQDRDSRSAKAHIERLNLHSELTELKLTVNKQDMQLDQDHNRLLELRAHLDERDREVCELSRKLIETQHQAGTMEEEWRADKEQLEQLMAEAGDTIQVLQDNLDKDQKQASHYSKKSNELRQECERLKRKLTDDRVYEEQSREIDSVVNSRWKQQETEWKNERSDLFTQLRVCKRRVKSLVDQKNYLQYESGKNRNRYNQLMARTTKLISDNLSEAELRSTTTTANELRKRRSIIIRARWRCVLMALLWRGRRKGENAGQSMKSGARNAVSDQANKHLGASFPVRPLRERNTSNND